MYDGGGGDGGDDDDDDDDTEVEDMLYDPAGDDVLNQERPRETRRRRAFSPAMLSDCYPSPETNWEMEPVEPTD